jgi:hypothetical protein
MVGTLKVDRIQKVNSDSDSLVFHDTGITLNKPLTDASGSTILNTDGSLSASGSVLQIAAKQHYNSSGHYTVTATELSSAQTYAGGVDITVKSTTSVNMVDFYTSMAYGAAGALIWNLQYSTDAGSTWSIACGTNIYSNNSSGNPTSDTPTSLMGSQGHQPSYGWSYDANTWGPRMLRFFHDHNQTAGTTIRYRVACYNNGSGQTNYFSHANYMVMNFTVTEIGEIG